MLQIDQARIDVLGRALLEQVRSSSPMWGSLAWMDDRGMAWSMADPQLKAALFRFVDALPNLADDRAVVSHLDEYLRPVAKRLPWPMRSCLGIQAWPIRPLVAAASHIAALRLAHRFIAGDTPAGAERRLVAMRRQRWAFTIDLLGEAVLSEGEADAYARAYHGLLNHLGPSSRTWAADDLLDGPVGDRTPRVNVSIKLSALTSRWDPVDPVGTSRRVRARLMPILERARAVGAFVNVDMEHHAYKDLTIAILREALEDPTLRDWPHVGIAIQAYLRSCLSDLAELAAWARRRGVPLWIRLVKGAYWDYETVIADQRGWPVPVFTDKRATDANFEACTRYLFEHRDALRPAIAGHNARSIAHALACAETVGAPAGSFEFQMLFGMVDPLKTAVAELGHRVRVYAPFGDLLPGMAYLVRRLLENTSNTSFVRAGFLDGARPEDLLMAPAPSETSADVVASGFVNEPPLDLSQTSVQTQMDAALAAAHASFPRTLAPVIDGVERTTTRTWSWANPSQTSEVIIAGCVADAALTSEAIAVANRAAPAWAALGIAGRAKLLRNLADRLAADRYALSALIMCEVGKNRGEADADVIEAIDFCRYYAVQAEAVLGGQRRDVKGELNELRYEPRGVAAVIAPWNFPLAILAGMTVGNLVVGNPVLVKPAEQACATAQAFHRHVLAAGIPAGVCQFLPGFGEEVGPVLERDPRVKVITFTGSRAVGLMLAANAIRYAEQKGEVTRVVAEMGGKNAIIVDADADLDEAVQGVLSAAFAFQGQKCSACSRVIVLAAVHDRFVDRLSEAVRSLLAGPVDDPGAVIGPVIDDEAVQRLEAAVANVRAPLRLAAVGPSASCGRFVAPRVIVGVPPDHPLAQEELFGPILAVIRVANLDEAIAVANSTRYALTGGCFTRSPATLERMRRELRVGNLYLNRGITGAVVDRQPFGGYRLSGIGTKAGGPDYLRQFAQAVTTTENTLRHGFAVNRDGQTNE